MNISSAKVFFGGCLISAALLFAASAHGQDPRVLRTTTVAIPPLVVVDAETGAISGEAVAAARLVAERCHLTLDVNIAPSWVRAYDSAKSGVADALIPTTMNSERQALFDFPANPFFTLYPALIVRQDSPFTDYEGVQMLEDRSVGIQHNMRLAPEFDTYIRSGSVRVIERGGAVSLLEELMTGRVDFLADSIKVLEYHLGSSSIKGRVRALYPPLGETPQYIALSKKRRSHVADGTQASSCLLDHP